MSLCKADASQKNFENSISSSGSPSSSDCDVSDSDSDAETQHQKPQKNKRFLWSDEQKKIMMDFFYTKSQFPSLEERMTLAQQISSSSKRVTKFFSHRRHDLTKDVQLKKLKKEDLPFQMKRLHEVLEEKGRTSYTKTEFDGFHEELRIEKNQVSF